MKKFALLLLALAMTLSIAGCGGAKQEEPSQDESAQDAEKQDNLDSPSQIDETVIYEDESYKITATGINHDGFAGPEVELLLENNSDKDVSFTNDYCVVNGYMIGTLFSSEVASGKKSNDSISLPESSLSDAGIGKFAEIQFNMRVFDNNTYETITELGDFSIKTNYYGVYEQENDDTGKTVYDKNGITVIAKGISEDSIFGPEQKLLIINNSGSDILVQSDSVSVNGFMVTAMFSSGVCDGMRSVDSLSFLSSDLEDNHIDTISEIEFSLSIINPSTYQTIDSSDPIVLTY